MAIETTFYVWVTTVSDSYTEQFVGKLVRRNWKVAALGNMLSHYDSDNVASVVAFSMSKVQKNVEPENEITKAKALEDVKDVLKRLKVYYYSVIVAEPVDCTWCRGNITQTELKRAEEERKKDVN